MNNYEEVKNEIEKTKKKVTIVFLVLVLPIMIFLIFGMIKFMGVFDKGDGELISEASSPNGEYSIKSYYIEGGNVSHSAVRSELIIKGHSEVIKDIYFDYNVNGVNMEWKSGDEVTINTHEISLPYGKYDIRE